MTLVFEKFLYDSRQLYAAVAQLGGSVSPFLTNAEAGLNEGESIADVARVLGNLFRLDRCGRSPIGWSRSSSSTPAVRSSTACRTRGIPARPCPTCSRCRRRWVVWRARRWFSSVTPTTHVRWPCLRRSVRHEIHSGRPGRLSIWNRFYRTRATENSRGRSVANDRPASGGRIGRRRLHRRLGQHGAGSRARKTQADFLAVPGECSPDGGGPENRRFMHRLPARRNMEVTDEVLDGPSSTRFRRPKIACTGVARGILLWLLDAKAAS